MHRVFVLPLSGRHNNGIEFDTLKVKQAFSQSQGAATFHLGRNEQTAVCGTGSVYLFKHPFVLPMNCN